MLLGYLTFTASLIAFAKLQELIIPVEPFTREMGVLAAKIDAETRKSDRVIATADLLIGVNALHHQYALVTHSVRHFQIQIKTLFGRLSELVFDF